MKEYTAKGRGIFSDDLSWIAVFITDKGPIYIREERITLDTPAKFAAFFPQKITARQVADRMEPEMTLWSFGEPGRWVAVGGHFLK